MKASHCSWPLSMLCGTDFSGVCCGMGVAHQHNALWVSTLVLKVGKGLGIYVLSISLKESAESFYYPFDSNHWDKPSRVHTPPVKTKPNKSCLPHPHPNLGLWPMQQQKQQQLQEGTPNQGSAIICQEIKQAYLRIGDFFSRLI